MYVGWETTAAFVADAVRTQGPFDGLLGFSQVRSSSFS